MIEFQENERDIKIFAQEIDSGCEGMLRAICNSPSTEGSKLRIMPDMHNGKGCVIGTTMTIKDKIVPNFIGVDIGCGVSAIRIKSKKRIDLNQLDKVCHQDIPHGTSIQKHPHRFAKYVDTELLYCSKHVQHDKATRSIGTLGSGNHYIELGVDSKNNQWLTIHTGSRHLGFEVATWYQDQAFQNCPEGTPYELAWVEGELMEHYLHDMNIVQEFAGWNRRAILYDIMDKLNLHLAETIRSVHNYIDMDDKILRKGAVSAKEGKELVIPMNMRDGCLICVGRGNPEWNHSAPHGAGRLVSRKDALNLFTLTEYKSAMEGIYSTTVSRKTIDESPMAYKPMSSIVDAIQDTVDIIDVIKPIYNFKPTT